MHLEPKGWIALTLAALVLGRIQDEQTRAATLQRRGLPRKAAAVSAGAAVTACGSARPAGGARHVFSAGRVCIVRRLFRVTKPADTFSQPSRYLSTSPMFA